MNILITGGTGFIGAALVPQLVEDGHAVTVLSRSRRETTDNVVYIDSLDSLGPEASVEVIINLAGASLADRRWTKTYKREIVSSRMSTTRAVLGLIERLQTPPAVLLNASAIGYYGASDQTPLDETSPQGEGFAADLCGDWEALASEVGQRGVRCCLLRLGVVLDRDGGALQEMARPFKLGVANWIGDGHQYLSWIHRDDVVSAIRFLMTDDQLSGPFNLTAPTPVTSREFCAAMKRHVRTLVTLPMPGVAMRALVGEMADELLISGQRVVPTGLTRAGFEFNFPDIDSALAASL